jgi:hypothetical protein
MLLHINGKFTMGKLKSSLLDTDRSASYIDLHLEIDCEGRLKTRLYDKRDDFNFPIVNFPFREAHV